MSSRCIHILLGKAFPEGFMPPWRIQHESHTCSEQSLRILVWNASYVQKTLQLNLTGVGWWPEARKFEMVLSLQIAKTVRAVKWHQKMVEKVWWNDGKVVLGLATSHLRNLTWNEIEAGTSIQRPGSISQNVTAVFVACTTMTFPAAPCLKLNVIMPTKIREVQPLFPCQR